MFKNYIHNFLIAFVFLILLSCTKDDSVENTPEDTVCKTVEKGVKIMPLGASRVQGFPPFFESYRYELWKDLIDGGWEFDFVGTLDDFIIYAEYNGYCFDTNHEGRSGWKAAQIDVNIEQWLSETDTPDIVLFSSPGANDILDGAEIEPVLAHINSIIDKIQTRNPNVTILIEQLAPAKSTYMTEDLTAIFAQIKGIINQIATEQTTATSKVIPVDMATGFSDDLLADDLHYNKAGAEFIATRYYDKLVSFLN
jgi:lysophospholipase L1-like esterase